MGELKINLINQWNFSFDMDDNDEIHAEHVFCNCSYCENTCLDPIYVYIINSLKEGGLLDENYKLICCHCALLKEFGMLDIRAHLSRIVYDDFSDILILRFTFYDIKDAFLFNDGEKPFLFNNIENECYVYFYIHDYSKINHWKTF